MPSKISRREVRLFQVEIISQVCPPILVELIANGQAGAIVGELFSKGPAEFLCEIDRSLRSQVHMVEDGRGNRVTNAGCPQVVLVVAKQMFSRGRQRMGEQPCFLLDSHIHIVCLKIAVCSSAIKMVRIESSPCQSSHVCFHV